MMAIIITHRSFQAVNDLVKIEQCFESSGLLALHLVMILRPAYL